MKHLKRISIVKADGFDDWEDLDPAILNGFYDFILNLVAAKGKGEEEPA